MAQLDVLPLQRRQCSAPDAPIDDTNDKQRGIRSDQKNFAR